MNRIRLVPDCKGTALHGRFNFSEGCRFRGRGEHIVDDGERDLGVGESSALPLTIDQAPAFHPCWCTSTIPVLHRPDSSLFQGQIRLRELYRLLVCAGHRPHGQVRIGFRWWLHPCGLFTDGRVRSDLSQQVPRRCGRRSTSEHCHAASQGRPLSTSYCWGVGLHTARRGDQHPQHSHQRRRRQQLEPHLGCAGMPGFASISITGTVRQCFAPWGIASIVLLVLIRYCGED